MSFYYFLPGVDGPAANGEVEFDFSRFGLGLSLSDIKRAPQDATAYAITIDGVDGLFVVPHIGGAAPDVYQYKPKIQTWLKVPVGETFVMIGWLTDSPPTPSTLGRSLQYTGYLSEGASGETWLIPIARGGVNAVTLPSDFVFDPITMEATETPSSDYAAIWGISGELYDHWNTDDFTLPPKKLAEYALKILAVNYRLGPIEQNALNVMGRKVIDTTRAASFGLALIDAQMLDLFKKKSKATA